MRNVLLAIAVLFFGCAPDKPTDEWVDAFCNRLEKGWADAGSDEEQAAFFDGAMEKAVGEVDMSSLTPGQLSVLNSEQLDWALRARIQQRLYPIFLQTSKQDDLQGAMAAWHALKYFPQQNVFVLSAEEKLAVLPLYKQVMTHPAWEQLVQGYPEVVNDLLSEIKNFSGKELEDNGLLDLWQEELKKQLPDVAVANAVNLFHAVFKDAALTAETKERVRKEVLKQYTALLEGGRIKEGKERKQLEQSLDYLQGACARGQLVGHPAPALDVIWSSSGKIKSLADLKGKVVMLDFWGTKCAPCVSIFPQLRVLKEYYQGYPVEIVGVTSIQGYHVDMKHHKTIRTAGKPELEIKLMEQLMEEMDITWEVVFSEQPVFNMEYGVFAIPHVVLIDADGIVRYNGMNPFESSVKKADKINALLQSKGLPCPKGQVKKITPDNM